MKRTQRSLWEGSPTPKQRGVPRGLAVVNEIGVGDASHNCLPHQTL
ncbi:hypothetical protein PLANPX_4654 [Lacipirellula parvula]|uniref:Uncharacterized protein n=1 Tax=Lacipirellula parvula TaxID=2650471 RepID=A0A5K7XG89_9BACT|nr:hypothetical protein PLANPX_4654 [Lacipirellula parvula]